VVLIVAGEEGSLEAHRCPVCGELPKKVIVVHEEHVPSPSDPEETP
jgi:hypothetical protein